MASSSKNNAKRKTYISSDDDDGSYVQEVERSNADAVMGQVKNTFIHSRKAHALDDATANAIQSCLTKWFLGSDDTVGVHDVRGMPWRKRYDPNLSSKEKAQRAYEVWVSEIMLQQTRVETVIPYYNKWMEAFPTVKDLAKSNIEAVNALWKGLGYYSRAARLYEGAKIVVEQFDSKLPDDIAVLQAQVPGIGRYSSGAICSIAYGKCVPVLDGNVNRLLSRVLALYSSPKVKATLDLLWAAAEDIVEDSTDPGAVNQALIELGSTVCTPKDPKCGTCPIKDHCGAYKWKTDGSVIGDIEDCDLCEPVPEGPRTVTLFPMKLEKKAVPEETDAVCVISWKGSESSSNYYLLRKRPKTGLLAGLWDFPVVPNVPSSSPKDLEKHARELVAQAFPKLGEDKEDTLTLKNAKVVGSVLHVFSHVKKTFQVVVVQLEGGEDEEQPPNASVGEWMNDRQPQGNEDDAPKRATKKRKVVPSKQADEEDDEDSRLKWVLEANVAQENLGTGTMKVWAVVQSPGGKAPKATKATKAKPPPKAGKSLEDYFSKTRK